MNYFFPLSFLWRAFYLGAAHSGRKLVVDFSQILLLFKGDYVNRVCVFESTPFCQRVFVGGRSKERAFRFVPVYAVHLLLRCNDELGCP